MRPVQLVGSAWACKQQLCIVPPIRQTRFQRSVQIACYTGQVTGSAADAARAAKPDLPVSAVFAVQQPKQQASPGSKQPATGTEQVPGMQQQAQTAEPTPSQDEGGSHASERRAASEGASSSGREYWQVLGYLT